MISQAYSTKGTLMDIWDTLIIIYGLVISPIMGVRYLKWRVNGGIKSFRDMLVYLVIGFGNGAATFFTIFLLPEGSWLIYPAALIVLFYIVVYAHTKEGVRMMR